MIPNKSLPKKNIVSEKKDVINLKKNPAKGACNVIKAHFLPKVFFARIDPPIPSQTKDTYNLSEQPLVASVRLLQSENNFYVVVKLYSTYSFRSTCYVFGKKGIQIRDLRDSLRLVFTRFLTIFLGRV